MRTHQNMCAHRQAATEPLLGPPPVSGPGSHTVGPLPGCPPCTSNHQAQHQAFLRDSPEVLPLFPGSLGWGDLYLICLTCGEWGPAQGRLCSLLVASSGHQKLREPRVSPQWTRGLRQETQTYQGTPHSSQAGSSPGNTAQQSQDPPSHPQNQTRFTWHLGELPAQFSFMLKCE